MASAYIAGNSAPRRGIEAVVGRLSDADLARTTESGWTVSALLAHLAFWDGWMSTLVRHSKADGVGELPVDPATMNGVLKPLCLAMDPKAAVRLCREAAATADAELESVTPEVYAAIKASPNQFRFNRGLPRSDHLGEIERLVGSVEEA
jgi:uncharacterized protein (TIGR03083 family)